MRETADNSKYISLIFIAWPFAALIVALKNYRSSWFKNIIWLFIAFYGLSISVEGNQNDSTRERDGLAVLHNQMISFKEYSAAFFSKESDELDIVNPILLYVVSRFTDNYHVLFAIYGLIFGFFYSRNISLLLSRTDNKLTRLTIGLLFVFAFINGFWNINGFRFWTAAQIYVYGVLLYFLADKKIAILVICSTFLVHFSFMLPIGIFGAYLILGNRLPLFFYLYLASFFVKELNVGAISEVLKNNLPDIFHNRIDTYTNEENIEGRKIEYVDVTWHLVLNNLFIRWVLMSFVVMFYYSARKQIEGLKHLQGLFSFSLLLGSVGNVAMLIPSAGRYGTIAFMLLYGFIFIVIQNFEYQGIMGVWKKLAFVPVFFIVAMGIRSYSEFGSVLTIFGNVFVAASVESLSVIEFVKSILHVKG